MVPNMKQLSCSMHLFLPSEEKTAELGRKRYEELEKDLEEMGLKEIGDWLDWMQAINIEGLHFWPLLLAESNSLGYNAPLLKAIAGQRQEGGVGCWYMRSHLKNHLIKITEEMNVCRFETLVSARCTTAPKRYIEANYHIATIEELIEAFPNEGISEQTKSYIAEHEPFGSEPEPRKIKKGMRLRCIKPMEGYLDEGEIFIAMSDEYTAAKGGQFVDIGYSGCGWRIDYFTIANEEPRKIRKGDRLLCVDDSNADLITKGHYYPALTNERDDKPNICIVNDDGELEWFKAKRFTIVGEVKEEKDWEESAVFEIGMREDELKLTVTTRGVWFAEDGQVDVSGFLRAVIAKYDQLKQQ